jgi:hypothetical protein
MNECPIGKITIRCKGDTDDDHLVMLSYKAAGRDGAAIWMAGIKGWDAECIVAEYRAMERGEPSPLPLTDPDTWHSHFWMAGPPILVSLLINNFQFNLLREEAQQLVSKLEKLFEEGLMKGEEL